MSFKLQGTILIRVPLGHVCSPSAFSGVSFLLWGGGVGGRVNLYFKRLDSFNIQVVICSISVHRLDTGLFHHLLHLTYGQTLTGEELCGMKRSELNQSVVWLLTCYLFPRSRISSTSRDYLPATLVFKRQLQLTSEPSRQLFSKCKVQANHLEIEILIHQV